MKCFPPFDRPPRRVHEYRDDHHKNGRRLCLYCNKREVRTVTKRPTAFDEQRELVKQAVLFEMNGDIPQ